VVFSQTMLIHRDHPTGQKWNCGECGVSIAAGYSCSDCHTILCEGCVGRTHRVPAGAETGKVCVLVAEAVAPAAA
jgi:hypothetical protein